MTHKCLAELDDGVRPPTSVGSQLGDPASNRMIVQPLQVVLLYGLGELWVEVMQQKARHRDNDAEWPRGGELLGNHESKRRHGGGRCWSSVSVFQWRAC